MPIVRPPNYSKLMADPRYWDGDHPEHDDVVRQVSEKFTQHFDQDARKKAGAETDDLTTDTTAADFEDRLYDGLLRRFWGEEGDVAVRPKEADPGGITKKGLSQRTLKKYKANRRKPELSDDPRELSDEQIAGVLRDEFFDRIHMPETARIPGLLSAAPKLIHQMFEVGAHSNTETFGKWLQKALLDAGFDPRDSKEGRIDGIVGPATRKALSAALKAGRIKEVNNSVVDQRIAYLRSLPNFEDNPGWIPRAERLRMK